MMLSRIMRNKLLHFVTAFLALLAASSTVSAANVRGANVALNTETETNNAQAVPVPRRRLDDKDSEDMDTDLDDEDLEGVNLGESEDMDTDLDDEDFEGVILEDRVCEPNAQRAIDFVAAYGRGNTEDASLECLADPVNGCDGGCCRLGVYFICDTEGFAPHLPCVCNSLTRPPPEQSSASSSGATTTPPMDLTLPNIVETAIASGSFTTLVDLVATAGLVSTLSGPGPFTVFAPVDTAFPSGADLDQFKSATSIEDLTRILTFHVVPGMILSTDLSEGAKVTTVEGNDLTFSLLNGPMVENANIIQTDIETSNGVIHVIDSVIMPPPPLPDIVETAVAAGSFNTLVDLVVTADLVDTLKSAGPFTLFAPSDAAFPTGQELVNFKSTTDIATLAKILTYHVVPGKIMSTDLVDGAVAATVQGANIEIDLSAAGAKVNDANIIQADIETSNGVIHVIDSVLMPPPDIVDTAIAAGSFTTLVDLVVAAGLVDTLKSAGPFTVFAPSDAAFPTGQELEDVKSSTDIATLTSILTYHVVPGKIMSTDLVDGAMVETVQGANIEIDLSASGAKVNDANIIQADIDTSNGVIHVIDGVLTPTLSGSDVAIGRSP